MNQKYNYKIILSVFIFVILVLLISPITLGERIKFGELLLGLNPAQPDEIPQIYELLIKKTQTGSGEGAYQSGDIVVARPAGHQWSAGEISNFWIVRMILTPSQAEDLVQSIETARRQYYIEPELLEGIETKKGMTMEMIEEK